MLFYDVQFLTLPKIKYNCVIETDNYHASLHKNSRLLELCYVESGGCVCDFGDNACICEPEHLYPMIFTDKVEVYTDYIARVKLLTIGLEGDFSISLVDSEQLSESDTRELMKNLLAGNRFLLPRDGISAANSEWVLPYLKKIVACKIGERIGEETHALSLTMELLSRITKASMDEVAFGARAFPTSAIAYSEMVVAYVTKNYRKRINVSELAHELGLSPNYLHAIFKQVRGVTIVDYVTSYRMSLAKVYIERFGLRAYEAALMVGIDDPAYFSRIFKKLYGKSVSEFKRDGE